MERTLRKLIVAGAVFTLYVASTLYIHSNFLGLQFKESIVGLLYTGASVLSLLGMMNIRTFVKNFGTKGSAVLFGILSITGIICLALSHNPILTATLLSDLSALAPAVPTDPATEFYAEFIGFSIYNRNAIFRTYRQTNNSTTGTG
jgi:hypothetical protein